MYKQDRHGSIKVLPETIKITITSQLQWQLQKYQFQLQLLPDQNSYIISVSVNLH